MNERRARVLGKDEGSGPVVYWMSREQRVKDNWALIHAQGIAKRRGTPLVVLFCLVRGFLGGCLRHYSFMLDGLREVQQDLSSLGIPFYLRMGDPVIEVPRFLEELSAGVLVAEFDPLRTKREWRSKVAARIGVPLHEVDAHNIVPCWVASSKLEYGAYTIRPKLRSMLAEFLDRYPSLRPQPMESGPDSEEIDWEGALRWASPDSSVEEVRWLKPGERQARRALHAFARNRLPRYSVARNDPTLNGQSNLSPYLHFGQISAQSVALKVVRAAAGDENGDSFLEELIVRRELSDNFCYYNPHYDSFQGFHEWARKTLDEHRRDEREYTYSLDEFERGATHDSLWNAAQSEMMIRGKMHGYMRMYWAKKILEWTESPEEALEIATYLNDRYELDGRDPNGYTGVAWSIGGVHDRAWRERPVFGKIRYMNRAGCERKFDVDAYIAKVNGHGERRGREQC